MALSDTIFQFTDASVVFTDSAAVTLALVHSKGDIAVSGANSVGGGNRAIAAYQTRGGANAEFGTTALRAAAHEPLNITLTLDLFDYTEATIGTILDWEARTSIFSAAVGFEAADAEVFSFGMVITYNRPNIEADQTATYTRVVITSADVSEGEPNTATINMTVYGTQVYA